MWILALFLILSIVIQFITFIIVLVKLFKEEGALKGIFGFICGIYTFIWGWIKHKQLQLTKMMLVWSIAIIAQIIL